MSQPINRSKIVQESDEEDPLKDQQPASDNADILSDSEEMNAIQQALFLNVTRSKSTDSLFGRLIGNYNDIDNRVSLVIEPAKNIVNTIIVNGPIEQTTVVPDNTLSLFRREKKVKQRGRCDYEKNICGYITKKIIRQFLGENYEKRVAALCHKHKCQYSDVKSYYLNRREYITGPSHLPELITPTINDIEKVQAAKLIFRQFYRWFLEQRYLRYLILEGKMTNKQAYITYKNNFLFTFITQSELNTPLIKAQSSRSRQRRSANQLKPQ